MYIWFIGFLLRLAAGERLEPAERRDYRWWCAFFFLMPLFVGLGARFAPELASNASPLQVWAWLLIPGIPFGVTLLLFGRFVPATASLGLGILTWTIGLWMAWHGKLFGG